MRDTFDIDVVSTMYPAMSIDKTGYCYRMRAVMTEKVNPVSLKKAVCELAPYYPVLYSYFKKTISAYKHIRATDFDVVREGEPYILLPDLYNTKKPAFRVYYKDNYISIDFFHGNGDGDASITYMKNLIEVYISIKDNIPYTQSDKMSDSDIYDDKYIKHFEKKRSSKLIGAKKALHIKLSDNDNKAYKRLSCISFSVSELKKKIKDMGLSINDYMIAALYFAITKADISGDKKHPAVISVPINLRPFFNEKSQRNFSYFVNIKADKSKNNDFNAQALNFKNQIKNAAQKEYLLNGIAQVVKTAKNPIVEFGPNCVKDSIIRFICNNITFRGITTTLSNVGYQKGNDILDKAVERLEVYLGSGDREVLNATAFGFKDKVSLCLSVASKSEAVENGIISIFKSDGISCQYTKQEFN